jgi:hypothetical protein
VQVFSGACDGKPYDHFSWSRGREDRLAAWEASNPWKHSNPNSSSSSNWNWSSDTPTNSPGSNSGSGIVWLVVLGVFGYDFFGENTQGTNNSPTSADKSSVQSKARANRDAGTTAVRSETLEKTSSIVVKGQGVRIRTAPDSVTSSSIIQHLDDGTAVRIVGMTENGWKEVEVAAGA